MAGQKTPIFTNDAGAEKVFIGSKTFKCIGASAPFDHPHIYIDMGADTQTICPYCSTLFIYDENLAPSDCVPAENKPTLKATGS